MSVTYNITTNFAAKDTLPSSDPGKVINGAPFSVEFSAIKDAFSECAPAANPDFTGVITAPAAELDSLTVTGLTTLEDTLTVTGLTTLGETLAEDFACDSITIDGVTSTFLLPGGATEGQRIEWSQNSSNWELADPLTATITPYDNSTSGLAAENVQDAIDEHVGDEDIHYEDAAADSVPRARMDNSWVSTIETVGSNKPTKLEVVSSLPGSPDADTIYIVTG